ncbi:hypothetical protein [Cochleicola gelatinilyticus]|uniref:Co-chaperone DjlA N-terminal domain-containing protein n=1 Tax=Cochleicola gelatinilyticus TaxID=1763537 RepID=A0A167H181_9FLAO|nr:hypothetical protein [Cochleicola gelatinilyticus]OAB78106.1 hypothetical protein ULVI_11530 [Cochleicola gelatinilyticus]
MSDFKTTWTQKELSAYLLLYCANVDYIESEEEVEMIRAKVDPAEYKSIHKEFEHDNDYQSIQKIQAAVERLGLSKTHIDIMIAEMKALFVADGEFDATEHALFNGIKKLLEEQ